jgi:REP element-mobilizing transposase RayT
MDNREFAMTELSKRKALRLKGFDYSSSGAYHITLCVKDRHEMLGELPVGANFVRPVLSEIGQIIVNEISVLSRTYDSVIVDKYVIMPNHIHMIIITSLDSGRTQFAPTISRIIKQFKGSITKKIGFSLWQKSFHDHIIRDDADYLRIWQYIDENPAQWPNDDYFPEGR